MTTIHTIASTVGREDLAIPRECTNTHSCRIWACGEPAYHVCFSNASRAKILVMYTHIPVELSYVILRIERSITTVFTMCLEQKNMMVYARGKAKSISRHFIQSCGHVFGLGRGHANRG